MTILVTGGCGYIGSHTAIELIKNKHQIIIFDNLSNSSIEVLSRIEKITGVKPYFVEGDLRDAKGLEELFLNNTLSAVIHFAGLKAVGDSVLNPLEYYENNVHGSLQLLKTMEKHKVKTIVFSSSATVYGDPISLPLSENMLNGVPTNPYGMSKLVIENMLNDLYISNNNLSIARLRYFNPVGAHSSGLIGEDPRGIPNNLMPLICQTALGKREKLFIFGNDYSTNDGTCVRDYIHVVDLAKGHLKALEKCFNEDGIHTFNLGTGKGFSVLELIKEFEKVCMKEINYEFTDRRLGDIAECYADVTKAKNQMQWEAELDLHQMCNDAWHWQTLNPNGFQN